MDGMKVLVELVPILIADDDPEDRMLMQDALRECRLRNPLYFVEDGEQLLDFLKHRGQFADPETSPRPGLVLLDLNMPKVDGIEALETIRADPDLRTMPVVVLTTSNATTDVHSCYALGVNSFITKPVTFEGLVEAVKVLGRYWFEVVELPLPDGGC